MAAIPFRPRMGQTGRRVPRADVRICRRTFFKAWTGFQPGLPRRETPGFMASVSFANGQGRLLDTDLLWACSTGSQLRDIVRIASTLCATRGGNEL